MIVILFLESINYCFVLELYICYLFITYLLVYYLFTSLLNYVLLYQFIT